MCRVKRTFVSVWGRRGGTHAEIYGDCACVTERDQGVTRIDMGEC